jgi:glycosyltransferase involved in cell wall biosynthesis
LYLRWVISRSLAVSDGVICVSDSVRREAVRLFPRLAPEKFAVVPHAAAPCFQPAEVGEMDTLRRRYGLPESYILMVGTFEPRKNPAFFRTLYATATRGGGADALPPLVWAGAVGFQGRKWLATLDGLKCAGKFRFVGSVDPEHLRALYQCAGVLVYPSVHEGFGFPVLEAMACGLPVVAADTTALPEVVGEGGICLPLDKPELWAAAIADLLRDQAHRREAVRRALAHAAEFSWEKAARRTAQVYDEAVARRIS